jgi:TonB family protein
VLALGVAAPLYVAVLTIAGLGYVKEERAGKPAPDERDSRPAEVPRTERPRLPGFKRPYPRITPPDYDEPPLLVEICRPEYPAEVRDRGVEGDVILLVYIDEYGRVRNIFVQSSPGEPALEEAAKEAAYRCEFEPAKKNGEPIGVWYSLVMQFRL